MALVPFTYGSDIHSKLRNSKQSRITLEHALTTCCIYQKQIYWAPTNQPTNQPTDQPTNQPTNLLSANQPASQRAALHIPAHFHLPANVLHLTFQPISPTVPGNGLHLVFQPIPIQPTNQFTEHQPTNQPIYWVLTNQPANVLHYIFQPIFTYQPMCCI